MLVFFVGFGLEAVVEQGAALGCDGANMLSVFAQIRLERDWFSEASADTLGFVFAA